MRIGGSGVKVAVCADAGKKAVVRLLTGGSTRFNRAAKLPIASAAIVLDGWTADVGAIARVATGGMLSTADGGTARVWTTLAALSTASVAVLMRSIAGAAALTVLNSDETISWTIGLGRDPPIKDQTADVMLEIGKIERVDVGSKGTPVAIAATVEIARGVEMLGDSNVEVDMPSAIVATESACTIAVLTCERIMLSRPPETPGMVWSASSSPKLASSKT